MIRVTALSLAFAFAMTPVGVSAAQEPSNPPSAPIPISIFKAKKVFISNASGEIPMPPDIVDLTYNEFYAAVKSWGRYEIVSAPSARRERLLAPD
jgi:hypothetical protein